MRVGAILWFVGAMAVASPQAGPTDDLHAIHAGSAKSTVESLPRIFKLMVWNIDRDEQHRQIRDGIARSRPDLALLQEVDFHAARSGRREVAADLAQDLSMSYVYASAFQEIHQGSPDAPAYQGQATLSKARLSSPRVLRFEAQTSFWNTPLLPSWFPQRRLGGRIGLLTAVSAGSSKLWMYNLHLESRGPGFTRYAQLGEVLTDADRIPQTQPVLLAGDLNTKYMASKFVDRLRDHHFQSCFGEHNPRTHRVIGSLDWVFVRGPVTCEASRVLKDVPGSDHYPLLATLRVH